MDNRKNTTTARHAARAAARAALALYRNGCQAQAKAIWQNAMGALV